MLPYQPCRLYPVKRSGEPDIHKNENRFFEFFELSEHHFPVGSQTDNPVACFFQQPGHVECDKAVIRFMGITKILKLSIGF